MLNDYGYDTSTEAGRAATWKKDGKAGSGKWADQGTGTKTGKQEEKKPEEAWGVPQPIPDGLLPVTPMPLALVPAAFQGWLEDVAKRMQVPLEFVTIPAIVVASSVIGSQCRIRPKRRDDWAVMPNLWGAVIGRPGVMKGPAIL